MVHLFSLNELNLVRFLVLALLRKPLMVLRVAPIFTNRTGPLQKFTDWAIRTGRASYAVTLVPELQHIWDFRDRLNFHDNFKKYEPWQNRYYKFDDVEIAGDPIYGFTYKQVTCIYTWRKVIEIYLLDAIEKKLNAGEYSVHGVLEDTLALGRDRFGPDFGAHTKPMVYPEAITKLSTLLLAVGFTLTWLATRMRFSVTTTEVAVAFESLNDTREFELMNEIKDAGKYLIVYRGPGALSNPQPLPEGMDYTECLRKDGLFAPKDALAGAAMAIRHIFRLYRRHWDAPPELLKRMLALPYKRLLQRGLLNRFRPGYFISRDEYNVDHVLRRAELRPLGIKSIGISNGFYPYIATLTANVRYVGFDTYFVNAAPLFSQYRDTWLEDMEVRTIGTYSLPRDKLSSVLGARGEDIVFTIRSAWSNPELVRMVRAVAKAFPERMVILQLKSTKISDQETERFIVECGEGLENIQFTTETAYALLERAKFHISDLSTFVAEAIFSGANTIMADLIDMEFNCYRQFPGLCVITAEELVEKLRALESGREAYPHHEYFELLGCKHGDVGYDLLREEIGLPSLSPSPSQAPEQAHQSV